MRRSGSPSCPLGKQNLAHVGIPPEQSLLPYGGGTVTTRRAMAVCRPASRPRDGAAIPHPSALRCEGASMGLGTVWGRDDIVSVRQHFPTPPKCRRGGATDRIEWAGRRRTLQKTRPLTHCGVSFCPRHSETRQARGGKSAVSPSAAQKPTQNLVRLCKSGLQPGAGERAWHGVDARAARTHSYPGWPLPRTDARADGGPGNRDPSSPDLPPDRVRAD